MSFTLTFTGDISFSEYFKDHGTKPLLDSKLAKFLQDSDHVIANIESAVTEYAPTDKTRLTHSSSPTAIKQLAKYHIDTWNIANNHIMDCGEQGFKDTVAAAKDNHVQLIGPIYNKLTQNTLILEKDQLKIGLIALTGAWDRLHLSETKHAVFFNNLSTIRQQAEQLRADGCNFIVAMVHAGEEFTALPTPKYREQYLHILDEDIDIIVAHHPHVPQNYERVGRKIIFYSLGNCIFDTDFQRVQNHTDTGVLLKLIFNGKSFEFEAQGTQLDRDKLIVRAAKLPANFRNIDDEDYHKLKHLVAHQFIINQEKANRFKYPNHHGKLRKALGRIKRLRSTNQRRAEFANLRYYFHKHPKNVSRKLVDYIEEDFTLL